MAIKTQVAELLNKKMDRQEFLKHVGLGVIAVSGASAMLRVLHPQSGQKQASSPSGYGSSAYGGIRNSGN